MEDGRKRYEVIHCCEYVGFLDGQEKRVGCLLHPMQNAGRDMRDVSFYGRELCDGHFCPSYSYISRAEKLAVLAILDDWYLYGVCITDIDLVKEFFRLVSEAAGEMPAPSRFSHPALREAARRFFDLKLGWPFRSDAANRFGKYSFDGTDYFHLRHRLRGPGLREIPLRPDLPQPPVGLQKPGRRAKSRGADPATPRGRRHPIQRTS